MLFIDELMPDFGGVDTDNAENISGAPKHNLLCSLEHKFPVPENYHTAV